MSYFPGAARKTVWEKKGSPSPVHYNPSLTNSRTFACAPFGSTTKLNRSLTNNRDIHHEPQLQSEEDFYSINNLNFKVKPEQQVNSVFKS